MEKELEVIQQNTLLAISLWKSPHLSPQVEGFTVTDHCVTDSHPKGFLQQSEICYPIILGLPIEAQWQGRDSA